MVNMPEKNDLEDEDLPPKYPKIAFAPLEEDRWSRIERLLDFIWTKNI